MKKLTDSYELLNGVKIPCVGFGTWQAENGEIAYNAVTAALKAGYRHIDTAAIYRNEESVGQAIKDSGVKREDIFVTTKLWNKCRSYELCYSAFERSLNKLGLDYVDLYLIHWPASPAEYEDFNEINLDAWRAMSEIYKSGKIKAIGVSNFLPHHLEALMACEIKPMVNQIEFHPGYMQLETVEYCKRNGIIVEAWSPLGSGRVLSDERLKKIGEKYGKSVADVCIRWCLQHGVLPLPKSVTEARIIENTKVFDFELSAEDMQAIDDFEEIGFSGFHPDKPGS
ncbi:MAG: aldo/keto reductase [Clostridia bacterium]|nr:aldo/keto reductase [Clostridia bacterium]